jgi:hypothetical protein
LAYEIIIQYFRDDTDQDLEPGHDQTEFHFNPPKDYDPSKNGQFDF